MQKAFSLQPNETRQLELLQSQTQRCLAQFGEATLARDDARAALKTAQEQQRSLLALVVSRHGVGQFQNARFDGTSNVVCEVPDEAQAEPKPQLVNGPSKGEHSGMVSPK